ncbi:hypothetical protein AKJ41_02020 [candidate division MSBL1 archaeon SCGC-AAA259O05]|uniref:Uncharacterized protein n=1 Tax=candidate division MSBL1 archaeon SCGC-AAA259O05 TaxID=1698271 RepID=A0A133V4G1_9EURY|nr:hypothetical protein AKJ41_02020 [candidate division MSBL1 archaeon SCGC-AAA259O05]
MALSSWEVNNHHIELEYPTVDPIIENYTLKVNGITKRKTRKIFGHPHFRLDLDGRQVVIKWSGFGLFAEPRCRVDGKLQPPVIEERSTGMRIFFIILVFILVFVAISLIMS